MLCFCGTRITVKSPVVHLVHDPVFKATYTHTATQYSDCKAYCRFAAVRLKLRYGLGGFGGILDGSLDRL